MTTIRAARPGDLPAVERLADFDVPPRRTKQEIARADLPIIRAQLESPKDDVLFLVAEDDAGNPVGTVFANSELDYFTQDPIAYVETLAVAPVAEGTGLARRLLAEVERWARDRGMRRVDLTVFAVNQRARGFYEHLGYSGEFVRYSKPVDER